MTADRLVLHCRYQLDAHEPRFVPEDRFDFRESASGNFLVPFGCHIARGNHYDRKPRSLDDGAPGSRATERVEYRDPCDSHPDGKGISLMNVRRAVITAAAPQQHTLPLQQLVDQQGSPKTALQLIVEEVSQAGVDEICVIIQPGDEDEYRRAAGETAERLLFVEQREPRGYGHALLLAREFVGQAPFLHVVGDHVFLTTNERRCAQQLVDVASQSACSVSAVQATRETKLPYFGAVAGQLVRGRTDLYEVSNVLEKPTPTQAEQELITAGLRAGYYLCFFGMHVLTPTVMQILADQLADPQQQRVSLSTALAVLAQRERYLALQLHGTRYDIGMKYGLLMAQLALALSGRDRDQILTELVELTATGSVTGNR